MGSKIGIPGSMTMSLYPDRSTIPRGDFFSLSTFNFHFGYSVSTLVLSCSGTFQCVTLFYGFIRVLLTTGHQFLRFTQDNIPFVFLRACFVSHFIYHWDFDSIHSVPYIERLGAKYMPAILSSSAEANRYYRPSSNFRG
jgi:hypothetical protein